MSGLIKQQPRNRSLEDHITTAFGLIAAVAGGLNQGGFYPRETGLISVISLAFLGYFTNKPLKQN
jgi:hypothetical protein